VTDGVGVAQSLGTRILREQSKDLSTAIYGVGGSGPTHPGTWQHLVRSGNQSTHLSGFADYSGVDRIEAVERGVIIPITPDIRVCGSSRTPGGHFPFVLAYPVLFPDDHRACADSP
jgi:hypothetical protein